MQAQLSPKAQKIAYALVALVAVGLVVEMTFLRGERVFSDSSNRFEKEVKPIVIPIDRTGERHTLEIFTKNFRDRDHKVSLAWELRDPQGHTVGSDLEIAPHSGTRRFDFVPTEAGDYQVAVRKNYSNKIKVGLGGLRDRTTYSVRVWVNDRRVLGPFLDWFKF